MMVVEFVVKLDLRKNKLESSKSKERDDDRGDHEENVGNDNDNDGNEKSRNGRRTPTPRRKKRSKIKCFFCDGSDILKNCLKKFVLSGNDKSKIEAKRLGSNTSGPKA